MKYLLFLLFSYSTSAAVLKHDVSSATLKEFSYNETCEEMGVKEATLISEISMTKLECLNKTFELIDFCLKKFPMDKRLTRGFLLKEKKQVICEFSDSVMMSLTCDSRDLKYCFNPKKGCEALRKIYANRLETAHFSMLEKNLNCYYSKPIGDTLNEI